MSRRHLSFTNYIHRHLLLSLPLLIALTSLPAWSKSKPAAVPLRALSEYEISLDAGEAVDDLAMELQSDYSPRTFPVRVNALGGGRASAKLSCPFVGSGVLRLKRQGAGPVLPLAELPVKCALAAERVESPSAMTSSLRTADEPGVVTIAGIIESAESFWSLGAVRRTLSYEPSSGRLLSDTTDETQNRITWTHDGTRTCTETITISTGHGLPPETFTIRGCFDTGNRWHGEVHEIAGTLRRIVRLLNSGGLEEDSTETQSVLEPSRYETTVRFDVPEGFEVTAVRVRAAPGFQIFYTRPPSWLFPGAVLVEGPLTQPALLNFCDNGVASSDAAWLLPADVLDDEGRFRISFGAEPNCAYNATIVNSNGLSLFTSTFAFQSGHLNGGVSFEADLRPVLQTLVLSTADLTLGPEIPRTDTFPATEPETTITALVIGGTVGSSVTVNIDIAEFDASLGGHLGHTPMLDSIPESGRTAYPKGRLIGDAGPQPNRPTAATCVATLVDDPNGEDPVGLCEVTFKAGEVAGLATIHGAIESSDPLVEDDVDVGIGLLLFDVEALFPRPFERFRDAATAGEHPNAYSLEIEVAERLLNLQRNWEELTVSPSHPKGTYLSMNDMSLPAGGLFDIFATWDNVHNAHRIGTSVDVNRGIIVDVETRQRLTQAPADAPNSPIRAVPGGVRVDKEKFRELCRDNGGDIVPEPSLHCEWRGRI